MAAVTSGQDATKSASGNRTVRFCSYCGTKLDEGARFCKSCGEATLDVARSIPETETRLRVAHEDPLAGNPTERKTVYEGYVHKCPNCGEILQSFVVNCPTCGYEFRDAKKSISAREFSAKLDEIERSRPTKILSAEERLDNQVVVSETDERKISLIRSFVIPNTKEDLFEFLVLASSNINMKLEPSSPEEAVSDAWEAKFEQAYEKAKLSFGHTQEFEKIQALYTKKKSEIKQSKKKRAYLVIGILAFIFVPFMLMFVFGESPSTSSARYEAENERLKVIAEEAYEALADENYVLARAKAASLTYLESHDSYTKKWDKTRKELLALIDAAANGAEVDIPETNKSSSSAEKPKEAEQSFSLDNVKIPADFISGYKEAEYSKYNSPASENGLGGNLIYFEGTLKKTEILDIDGTQTIFGYVADADDNTWFVMMNCVPIVTETYFDAAIGKTVVCTVVYEGYSGTYNLPFAILNELMILENGTVFNGVQKLLDE